MFYSITDYFNNDTDMIFFIFFFIEKLNLSEFQIDSWLINIADQYPTLAKVESIGSSHEGRDMKLIRVNKPQQFRRY